MKRPESGKKLVKYVWSPEDWHPSFPDGFVRVFKSRLHTAPGEPRMWRVAVWGMDDTGVELDTLREDAAEDLYDAIQDGITRKQRFDWGFRPA